MTSHPRRTTLAVLAGLLVAVLLMAGVAAHYASSSPDGLERVAVDQGFDGTAEQHAGADGPLADYQVRGAGDGRLATGAAGLAGSVVVLVLAGGLIHVVRRRTPAPTRRD